MNNLTTKLGGTGQEVLAKLYKGEPSPVMYANRTQAERKLKELGVGWFIYHTGRPFYIGRDNPVPDASALPRYKDTAKDALAALPHHSPPDLGYAKLNPSHTPGPWHVMEVHRNPDCLEWVIGCVRPATDACKENPRIAICDEMGGSGDGREEGRANAHLIAAAPELLAALEGVLKIADRQTVEFDEARAAIAKAKGTTLRG